MLSWPVTGIRAGGSRCLMSSLDWRWGEGLACGLLGGFGAHLGLVWDWGWVLKPPSPG